MQHEQRELRYMVADRAMSYLPAERERSSEKSRQSTRGRALAGFRYGRPWEDANLEDRFSEGGRNGLARKHSLTAGRCALSSPLAVRRRLPPAPSIHRRDTDTYAVRQAVTKPKLTLPLPIAHYQLARCIADFALRLSAQGSVLPAVQPHVEEDKVQPVPSPPISNMLNESVPSIRHRSIHAAFSFCR